MSGSTLAVLASGGLDSSILLAEAARERRAVHPLYIRTGATWETEELRHLKRFLLALNAPSVRPVVELAMPVADLYGPHWSLGGAEVPDAASADEAVYLPGRNVLLLAKALLWCHLNGVPDLATAPLAGNPFPDTTAAFYDGFARAVNEAVAGSVRVIRPYAKLTKAEVIRRGANAPLAETLSCLRPVNGRHCGACNKCAERRKGFSAAGLSDPARDMTEARRCSA